MSICKILKTYDAECYVFTTCATKLWQFKIPKLIQLIKGLCCRFNEAFLDGDEPGFTVP